MRTANNQKHCHIQEDLSAPQYNYRTLKSWVWYAVSSLGLSTDVPTTADNVTQSNSHYLYGTIWKRNPTVSSKTYGCIKPAVCQ